MASIGREFLAAKMGDLSMLQSAVADGFDVNSKSRDNITCLQVWQYLSEHEKDNLRKCVTTQRS